ncbi:MAG TPA: hypothetical protein VF048_00195, partial [Gemmatimonadaceae bacterium]
MTHTDRFVRHLDRLVRLLADHPDHVAEQKRAMRDACEAIAEGEVSLHATPHALLANGAPVTGTAAAAGGLAARLHSSGARRLYIARDAAPADLLRAARLLAAGESLAGLELRTVRSSSALETPLWTTLVGEPLERAEADAAAAAATERDPDFLPPGGICVPQTWSAPAALAASPAAEAAMDGAMEELASHVTPAYPPPAVAAAGAARVAEEPALSDASLVAYTMEDERPDVLTRPTPMHTERVLATDELSSRIAKLTSLAEVNRLLEELAVRAELAARDGIPAILHEVLTTLVQQEEAVERPEKRLAIGIVLRRLLSTAHLRLVASLIPRQPEAREQILAVLARAENSGADAVLEHLVESESKSDRRAYFNALLQLPARETALIHMLGDQRWYVVRNAAELVGEMGLQA